MNICSFTSLDDLKKNCTTEELLSALKTVKRFSSFEPLWLLLRIESLWKAGKIELDLNEGYPWTGVKVLP